jgi:hypothetical protein
MVCCCQVLPNVMMYADVMYVLLFALYVLVRSEVLYAGVFVCSNLYADVVLVLL